MNIPSPTPLDKVRGAFQRWLGKHYDLDAIYAVLATAAAERLTGDPAWLLVISGSGNAKTETVSALAGAGAIITSIIASEGALLSGTAKRDKSKDAHGGLLRRIGERGVLVVKDVSSLLSLHRDARAGVLAAFREIHDGKWERNIGTDGGRTLTWQGRIAVIGACTTAWDTAHSVIATMGDRFVVLRMDSSTGRQGAGLKALKNTGEEVEMRAHLAEVVRDVLKPVTPGLTLAPTDAELNRLLLAADLVTLARTAVEMDYKGDVIDAHAPEMPTRFAKQLLQVMRGAWAIGLDRREALRLAIRCARDSMPPLRLANVDDVAAHPHSRTSAIRERLDKPYNTIDRQLQSLHMLGILTCDEVEREGGGKRSWYYSLQEGIDPTAIQFPEMSTKGKGKDKESREHCPDISGNCSPAETPVKPNGRDPSLPVFDPRLAFVRPEQRS